MREQHKAACQMRFVSAFANACGNMVDATSHFGNIGLPRDVEWRSKSFALPPGRRRFSVGGWSVGWILKVDAQVDLTGTAARYGP
jgi:hypothetical protein